MSSDASTAVAGQLRELAELADRVGRELAEDTARVAGRVLETLERGGKLLFCGNGGSAADAQHLAAEYVVRFSRERRGLPAVALTTDTSVLTAGANDYGFEEVFSRQVEALADPRDLLVLHSTSGNSENLIRAARAARERGVATVAFLARGGGALRGLVDLAVVVPTDVTARAQEIHLALEHVICDLVDEAVAQEGAGERALETGDGAAASRGQSGGGAGQVGEGAS